jgi:hypothetical protein
MDIQVRKLTLISKLFGNTRLQVVPAWTIAPTCLLAPNVGTLALDEDDDDDEPSYNFEMNHVGDATTTAPDQTADAYLKRKFDTDRIRVVPRFKSRIPPIYVGQEYTALFR